MQRRFGKYLLQKKIAAGGMAEVHLALERMPHGGERFVVIKTILPDHADDPDFIDFFLHEARLSLQLCHPNLVQTYEFGVERGVHYLTMEYVRGQTLLSVLRQASLQGRHLSLGSLVKIAIDITAGLDHAHHARDPQGRPLGLIHRDVSPHNVLIGYEGIAKLADFGVARTENQPFKTRAGVVKGKFAYLAPEQLRRGATIDHRVDLFAVGIVLYEMLSRRPLFRGHDETDTLQRIVRAKIPPVRTLRPDCPEPLEAVVMRALERNPDRRYPTAAALLADLEDAARSASLPATVSHLREEMADLFPDASTPTVIPVPVADDEDTRPTDDPVSPPAASAEVAPPASPRVRTPPAPPPPEAPPRASDVGFWLERPKADGDAGADGGSPARRRVPRRPLRDSALEHFLRLSAPTPAPTLFASSMGVRIVTASLSAGAALACGEPRGFAASRLPDAPPADPVVPPLPIPPPPTAAAENPRGASPPLPDPPRLLPSATPTPDPIPLAGLAPTASLPPTMAPPPLAPTAPLPPAASPDRAAKPGPAGPSANVFEGIPLSAGAALLSTLAADDEPLELDLSRLPRKKAATLAPRVTPAEPCRAPEESSGYGFVLVGLLALALAAFALAKTFLLGD